MNQLARGDRFVVKLFEEERVLQQVPLPILGIMIHFPAARRLYASILGACPARISWLPCSDIGAIHRFAHCRSRSYKVYWAPMTPAWSCRREEENRSAINYPLLRWVKLPSSSHR